MEILYYLSTLCLVLFMVLATYDGFYLHIWKYELFRNEESNFEHKTHAVRAILFPLIIWLIFIDTCAMSFWMGISLSVLDLIVLGIDAYVEEDSRKSMGGLPKWEYILHLFANSFHFASIVLMIGTRVEITELGLSIMEVTNNSFGHHLINTISVNIIPGAVVLALVHLLLMFPNGIQYWDRVKFHCC